MTRQSRKKDIYLYYGEIKNVERSLKDFHLALVNHYNQDFYPKKDDSNTSLSEDILIFNYLNTSSFFDKNNHGLRLPGKLKFLFNCLQILSHDKQDVILRRIYCINKPLFKAYLHKLSLKHLIGPLKLIDAIPFNILNEGQKVQFFGKCLKKASNQSLDNNSLQYLKDVMQKNYPDTHSIESSFSQLEIRPTPSFNCTFVEINMNHLFATYEPFYSFDVLEKIIYKMIRTFDEHKKEFSCEHMEIIPKGSLIQVYLYGKDIKVAYLHDLFKLQIDYMLSLKDVVKSLNVTHMATEVIEKLQFEKVMYVDNIGEKKQKRKI